MRATDSTGVNIEGARRAVNLAASNSETIMTDLKDGLNEILTTYQTGWGTQSGKDWVEGSCTTDMNALQNDVADLLKEIGEKIAGAANGELTGTDNSQSIAIPDRPKVIEVQGKLNDVLPEGVAGVLNTFKDDAALKSSEVQNRINADLGALQSQVIQQVSSSFSELGSTGQVYADVMSLINKIKTTVETQLASLKEFVDTSADNAEKVSLDLQKRGLSSSN